MNKTSRTEHSQKYGRVATRTKGREKKVRYFLKKNNKENKQNFLQLIAFTHGTQIRFFFFFPGVRCATPSQRGSSMAVCFRKKKCGLLFMLYSIIQKHAAVAWLQHVQASPASMPTTQLRMLPGNARFNLRCNTSEQLGCDFVHTANILQLNKMKNTHWVTSTTLGTFEPGAPNDYGSETITLHLFWNFSLLLMVTYSFQSLMHMI